ncbi:hypothetical protein DF3PA_160040 [Candidatus Defluviicoccus seviourii]|uniref:Uncharacterized protein n=1 Tax=Candidatus Defluviicoccus seviourii TaxID=2565273 RepID=A0A564WEB1_9PROT|nr:hypothetical protein DF3PA_160040 [Candidatus Defluviicoccus seviourii]
MTATRIARPERVAWRRPGPASVGAKWEHLVTKAFDSQPQTAILGAGERVRGAKKRTASRSRPMAVAGVADCSC